MVGLDGVDLVEVVLSKFYIRPGCFTWPQQAMYIQCIYSRATGDFRTLEKLRW